MNRKLLKKFRGIFRIKRLIKAYTNLGIILINTLVIFFLLNIFSYIYIKVQYKVEENTSYPLVLPAKVPRNLYPNYTDKELQLLMYETWNRPYTYEPYTIFRERTFSGKYVNVSENGFRYSEGNETWPPDQNKFNVFFFGGSTTFGYGVADFETIASQFRRIFHEKFPQKNVEVYNFGRGYYFSTPERILYEQLITSGVKPNVAIFIDGLNEFASPVGKNPLYNDVLSDFVDEYSRDGILKRYLFSEYLLKVPVYKLIKSKINHSDSDNILVEPKLPIDSYNNVDLLNAVINRFISNKNLIDSVSDTSGVCVLHVWQPVPAYKYPQEFRLNDYEIHNYSYFGYPQMSVYIKSNPMGVNFLWLADIQNNTNHPYYIDNVHYSAEMSINVAEKIFDYFTKHYLNLNPVCHKTL